MSDASIADPIVFERVLPVSPDEAFELVTDPDRLRRWMAISAAIDLRIGGDVRLTIVPGSVNEGTVVEVVPGRRYVSTWGWTHHDDPGPGGSTVEIDVEPHGEGTLLRLTHHGLSPESAAPHGEGWEHFLDRLTEAARHGDAGPDPWAEGIDDYDPLSSAEACWAICARVLRQLAEHDRSRPTPCEAFTVHDLFDHLVDSVTRLGAAAGAEEPVVAADGELEPRLAVVVEGCLAAWRGRGTDGEVAFGEASVPATFFLGILSLEFLIHAWDFAQAVDAPLAVPPTLVDHVRSVAAETIKSEYRGEGKGFAEITPTSTTDALTELMAFTGRTIREERT